MPLIRQSTMIRAPQQRVFDLARSIDVHTATTSKTKERAVDGRVTGLIESGETVTWEAVHLGVKQRLTVRVTAFEPPNMFMDEMVLGAFKALRHRHLFVRKGPEQTEMIDELEFCAPLGILGMLAERAFLTRYMGAFLGERNRELKQIAESDGWSQYLPNQPVASADEHDVGL